MNFRYRFVGLVCLCFSLLLGCGDGRPTRVPVQGVVLIDGEPLAHGFIQVIPDDGRPAQSALDANGRFRLTTFEENDGCIPGTHQVAVLGRETISPTVTKWHAPKKYMSPATSELKITVESDTEIKEHRVKLTWGDGKPFEEKFAAEEVN